MSFSGQEQWVLDRMHGTEKGRLEAERAGLEGREAMGAVQEEQANKQVDALMDTFREAYRETFARELEKQNRTPTDYIPKQPASASKPATKTLSKSLPEPTLVRAVQKYMGTDHSPSAIEELAEQIRQEVDPNVVARIIQERYPE